MSGIENADNGLRFDLMTFLDDGSINRFPDPILALVIFTSEIFNRLSLPNMLLPNLVGKLLRSSFVLKLFTAIGTPVVLDTSPLSILLYSCIFTVWALFLRMVCS